LYHNKFKETKKNPYNLTSIVFFPIFGDFTWRVSDCEELVGVTHRRWCEWTGVCSDFFLQYHRQHKNFSERTWQWAL